MKMNEKVEKIFRIIQKDPDYLIRYRENQILVYYFGQRIFDVTKDNISLPETLMVSGKYFHDDKKKGDTNFKKCNEYQDYLIKVRGLKEYADCLDARFRKIKINYSSNDKPAEDIKRETAESLIAKLENESPWLKNPEDIPELHTLISKGEVKLEVRDDIGIKDIVRIQQDIFAKTVGKPPFAKPECTIDLSINLTGLNEVIPERFCKLSKDLKDLIREYNKIVGGMEEKMFQQTLMHKNENGEYEINRILNSNKNLLPYEEELTIYPNNGKINKKTKILKAGKLEEKIVVKKDLGSGRIDNVYINKENGQAIFVEIKIDSKVIAAKNNGVIKHLFDIMEVLDNSVEQKRIYEELNSSLAERLSMDNEFRNECIIDKFNPDLKFNFYIICGYSSLEEKKKIINNIEEDLKLQEYKEIVSKYKKKSEDKMIDTRLFLIKIEKEEDGGYKIREELDDCTGVLFG